MADNETVTMRLPSGETVDLIVPKGMSDDQVRTLYAQKFPKDFAAAKAQPPQATGTISAAPTGVGPWLQNLENDVRTGSGNTLPGRMLQKLGARGTDTGMSAKNRTPQQIAQGELNQPSNPLLDTALGPIHMAQGIVSTPQHPVMGPLKVVGGALEAANIPLSFMGNAPGVAESVLGKTIPGVMMEQGGQKIGQASQLAAKVPVDISAPGNQALKVKELLDAGAPTGGVSKLINQFIRRVSDPNGAPMTFDEARRFYTNATAKTSAEELSKMSGPMRREFSQFVGRLGDSITSAAGQVGQANTYTSGMQQFAAGAARQRALVNALKYGGSAAGGGLLTHYLIEKAMR